jgi:hypothetical protein
MAAPLIEDAGAYHIRYSENQETVRKPMYLPT